jgi:hypothetical protein
MKQWTVYFRDKNGSKASVVIEAEDRSGVFAELKKRGISAISVTEGAFNKKPRKAASSGAPSKGRGLFAAALLVLLAGVAMWFMWPEEKKVVEEKRISNVKHGISEVKNSRGVTKSKEVGFIKRTIKGDNSNVIKRKLTAQERVAAAQLRQKDIPLAHPRKPKVFKNASDQILAMVAQIAEGKDVPPIPIDKNFEKEFFQSLKEPILINEDDSENIKILKESVIALRKELSERADGGESAYNILKDYQKQMAEDYKVRSEMQSEARKILESGDRAGAEEFVKKINIALNQVGIKEIEMPMTPEERKEWARRYMEDLRKSKENEIK